MAMGEVTTASTDWIDLGDRSHPNLKLVDELKGELTYDGHKNDLQELEQAHFEGHDIYFDRILHRVREKEKMSVGDRSHPNLVRLDELIGNVTYDGWTDDLQAAEKQHLDYPQSFDFVLKEIERKQKLSVGDRSDEELIFLDSLRLSYPGWEKDWQDALRQYTLGYYQWSDSRIKFSLTEKQRMHNGDRSHPRLVALDSLQLTYPGWEEDATKYERQHTSSLGGFESLPEDCARKEIEIMKGKQKSYCSGVEDLSWMTPDQRTIVNTRWTFPGWEEAVHKVREMAYGNFDNTLEHFQVRQMLHEGDNSRHHLLIELQSMHRSLSYPNWEEDFGKTKSGLNQNSSSCWDFIFEMNIQGIRKKQTVYDGYIRSLKKKSKPKSMSKQKYVEATGLKECVVCWVAPRTHVFVPCGHMCACKSCSSRLMESRKICPTCNQSSTMAIEVFLP